MTTAEKKPGAESAKAPNTETPIVAAVEAVDSKAVATAERERIKAITTHESAANKSALANHLALSTDLSVEAAAAIMASAAAETAGTQSAGASAFEQAMDTSAHPNVGADSNGGEGLTAAQRILRSQEVATGMKH